MDSRFLRESIGHLLDIFIDIWGVMCRPFIDTISVAGINPNQYTYYSYLIPVMCVGFGFCSIALTKKIICMFIGRGSIHDV